MNEDAVFCIPFLNLCTTDLVMELHLYRFDSDCFSSLKSKPFSILGVGCFLLFNFALDIKLSHGTEKKNWTMLLD